MRFWDQGSKDSCRASGLKAANVHAKRELRSEAS